MRVNSFCAACLWDKQLHKSDDPGYLAEVRQIIDTRKDEDTAPYLVYLFNRAYERRFGKTEPYKRVKQKYNDVVLSMENEIRRKIESSSDPLAASIASAERSSLHLIRLPHPSLMPESGITSTLAQ